MERKILTLLEFLVREDLPKETLILLGIAQIRGGLGTPAHIAHIPKINVYFVLILHWKLF